MAGTMKEWLVRMYEDEIASERATVDNETVWAAGAAGPEERDMHTENAAMHERYIRLLCARRDRILAEGIGEEDDE